MSGFIVALVAFATLRGAGSTSSKMDYLPLGDVRTDPVTTPNGLSPHMHTFYGAAGSLRPSTSYAELRAACGNSGNVDDNKSLYWHPSIYKYDPVSGLYHLVPIWFASTYYVWRTGQTRAFPNGFQMIARQHNPPGVAVPKARVSFECAGPSACEREDCSAPTACEASGHGEDGQSSWFECFPQVACAELEIKIVFPACWDGTSLTSEDFMSHVAYTEGDWGSLPEVGDRQHPAYSGECPSTHPVRIPEIQFYFRIQGYEGGHHVFSDGTNSVHADYFSGWDEAELQKALDECDNDSEAASPDAWCENHLRFRDAPKSKGDDLIIEKLRAIQPNPPLDLQHTVAAEAITAISVLPHGSSDSSVLPIDPRFDWHCTPNCSLLGSASGDRSGSCPGSGVVSGGSSTTNSGAEGGSSNSGTEGESSTSNAGSPITTMGPVPPPDVSSGASSGASPCPRVFPALAFLAIVIYPKLLV